MMKRLLTLLFLAAVEILLIGTLFVPRLIDRYKVANAVAQYANNPTKENELIRNEVTDKYRRNDTLIFAATLIILTANTFVLFRFSRGIRKAEPAPSPSSSPGAGSESGEA
ncbi:MAG: hypothetical protein U1E27_01190 [Kiritimatiellia bacterium]|nr:hypothetical protein [Kiritimatiellia bacterium]